MRTHAVRDVALFPWAEARAASPQRRFARCIKEELRLLTRAQRSDEPVPYDAVAHCAAFAYRLRPADQRIVELALTSPSYPIEHLPEAVQPAFASAFRWVTYDRHPRSRRSPQRFLLGVG